MLTTSNVSEKVIFREEREQQKHYVPCHYRKVHFPGSGLSTGITIPKDYVRKLGLANGTIEKGSMYVKMYLEGNRLIIEKV